MCVVFDGQKAAFGAVLYVSTGFYINVNGIAFQVGFDVIGTLAPG
jgi:hypothetical protein